METIPHAFAWLYPDIQGHRPLRYYQGFGRSAIGEFGQDNMMSFVYRPPLPTSRELLKASVSSWESVVLALQLDLD